MLWGHSQVSENLEQANLISTEDSWQALLGSDGSGEGTKQGKMVVEAVQAGVR